MNADPSTTIAAPSPQPTADTSALISPGVLPTRSGTALPASQINNCDGASEAPRVADGSLWDRAYNALQNEQHDRIAAYEDLLTQALAQCKSLSGTDCFLES